MTEQKQQSKGLGLKSWIVWVAVPLFLWAIVVDDTPEDPFWIVKLPRAAFNTIGIVGTGVVIEFFFKKLVKRQ
jgi:hypothetical protein